MTGPRYLSQVDLPVAYAPIGDHKIIEAGNWRHLLKPGAGACCQTITSQIQGNQTGSRDWQSSPGVSCDRGMPTALLIAHCTAS
jgi:hypothetical protein